MLNFIVQNFNWPTFFIALAVFVLISNITSLIVAIIKKRRAYKQLNTVEKQYQDLQKQLKDNEAELNKALGSKENK